MDSRLSECLQTLRLNFSHILLCHFPVLQLQDIPDKVHVINEAQLDISETWL